MSKRPVSLVAERAVRYLRGRKGPVDSRRMARELLATNAKDERAAQRVLAAAFGEDPRLQYTPGGGWTLTEAGAPPPGSTPAAKTGSGSALVEPDRTLIFLRGGRPDPAEPYRLDGVSVIRLQGDEVLTACGGDAVPGPPGNRLRRAVLETLDGAVPVLHDPPGALRAFEDWLQEPLDDPISLRRVGRDRLNLPARHDLADLAARLDLAYREVDDPLEQADTLDACLRAVRRPDEMLQQLRIAATEEGEPLDWSRYAFNREYLRRIPRVPGTYEFYDAEGNLIYVGKAKNLHDRLASYFSSEGRRSTRVRKLLDALHRIEYRHSGSALEAALREAELIAQRNPRKNVQRNISAREGRGARLKSILILEPAESPSVLRAYLIRNGRLLDRVGIGPRGGGLKRIERVLEDRFFSCPTGPTPLNDGPDLDVELIVRWLAENRDRVVAFDPTDLQGSQEVIDRLRWFLDQGTPFDSDGSPILTR